MNLIPINIVRFVFLMGLQILVMNQISLGFLNSYISISIYISFLLTFSTKASKYFTMLVAFFVGLTMDMFLNTAGVHASACVFLAFVRPSLLARIKTSNPLDYDTELTVFTEDIQKYILYSFILTSCFFFWLFLMEEFSFTAIPLILLKTILSSTVSVVLIILGQYLLFRKPKN